MSINVLWLPLICIVSALFGFMFRSHQIKKSKKRILSLENEMLNNHAQILSLEQEIVNIKKEKQPAYKSRVVPMNELSPEDNPGSKDNPSRKKNIN